MSINNSQWVENKNINVKVFKDRLEINLHPYNPLKDGNYISKLPPNSQSIKRKELPFMTRKQYKRQLKNARKRLFSLNLDSSKCVFMTLGTNNELNWNQIQDAFNLFIVNARNKYGDFGYIRAIECYNKGFNRYHIHIILVFFYDRPILNRAWLKNHWKYGKVHLENVWNNRHYGLLEYITLIKSANFQPEEIDENNKFTKFPPNVKIISLSRNLEKDKSFYEIKWTKSQYNYFINEVKKCNGQIFYDGHYYKKDKYCLDKVFIHNSDDAINLI